MRTVRETDGTVRHGQGLAGILAGEPKIARRSIRLYLDGSILRVEDQNRAPPGQLHQIHRRPAGIDVLGFKVPGIQAGYCGPEGSVNRSGAGAELPDYSWTD